MGVFQALKLSVKHNGLKTLPCIYKERLTAEPEEKDKSGRRSTCAFDQIRQLFLLGQFPWTFKEHLIYCLFTNYEYQTFETHSLRDHSLNYLLFIALVILVSILKVDERHERLRGAAQAGNIDALYALIREDAYLLDGIDQIPFFDTPLHTAAAAGHTDFSMEVMNLKPSLALKLNHDGFSPIHLALQNGQKETVLNLLGMDKDLVRVKGKEGKTPLHYVVGEADLSLVLTFLLCCPECIRDVTNQNETALHIAAQKNLLEALQVPVGWLRSTHDKDGKLWEKEVLNWKNKEGDTVLHIAMVELLLDCGIEKNAMNWRGLTAMDIVQGQSRVDNKRTLEVLRYFGCSNASSIHTNSTLVELLRSKISFSERSNIVMSRMRKNISNGTRDALLVVLGLILTTTYESAVNPPYDLFQSDLPQQIIPQDAGGQWVSPNDGIMAALDPLALSFSIFNAVNFLVTLLVTLFILPWVPYAQLLHVPLLLIFIFFVASMGLSLALMTSVIGIGVFCSLVVITTILGIFIVMNKVRSRKVYTDCIKEVGDRVRLHRHEHDDIKKK
ncbi:ankyrin repeat-containing protein BDA1-like [Herrania umbratica]|uniref:Ankyrin repeat-containing protein BDA1-like n=1 Tax=Herrania umbratica TaxID=108875 RepID=A0A6J1BCH0_9ROSI|nr:ankyrin repeat-containing protein BDA1-like [Herrania umbratica]